jgi:hypothetical protein
MLTKLPAIVRAAVWTDARDFQQEFIPIKARDQLRSWGFKKIASTIRFAIVTTTINQLINLMLILAIIISQNEEIS